MKVGQKMSMKVWIISVLYASTFFSAARADEGAGKCYLNDLIKSIGYKGVMSTDPELVSLEASMGNEARCVYQVQFSGCIGKALKRFDTLTSIRGASAKARGALMMVNLTKALTEHGVEISYSVEKAGFFSRPKFTRIVASENLFGFLVVGREDVLDNKNVRGWRQLCDLGNMSEADFLKEVDGDKGSLNETE